MTALLLLFLQDEIPRLLDRLKTEDPVAQRKALDEFALRGAEALPAALAALGEGRPGLAAEVDALVRRLGSAKWEERDAAMRDLARLGRPARPLLADAEKSPDPETAWRVRAAAGEIDERAPGDERLEQARNGALCEFLGESGDARAVAPLLRLLSEGTGVTRLRLRAADGLGRLRAHLAPPQVEEAAEGTLQLIAGSPAAEPRALLVRALGRLGSKSAVAPLSRLLVDRSEKNAHVKRACIAALAATGEGEGLHAVVRALEAEEVYVRQAARVFLEPLAGEAHGFDPRGTAESNAPAVAKFRSWWSAKYGRDW